MALEEMGRKISRQFVLFYERGTGIIYRIPDQPGCLCPPLLESMPYLTAVSEVGKAGQHALAGDAVIVWMQPREADLRNLFPLGRTNYYWHSVIDG